MKRILEHGRERYRRHARHVWMSRGGGFYGFVAMVTFLWLEATQLAGDVAGLRNASLDVGWVIGWVVGNFIDAIMNLVSAAIWPVEWIGRLGVGLGSLALLGAAWVGYRLVRPWVLRFLEGDGGDEDATLVRPPSSSDAIPSRSETRDPARR